MEEAERIRTLIQESVYDMLPRPPQRVVRLRIRRVARRVLVTGADTFWGGRMIQALEADPNLDMILGMGARAPSVPFERAEFVRADQNYSIVNRIVKATQVDTILHTFMVTDSDGISHRRLHEINVIGTMNLLAAAGASGSSVRHIVVKSSTLVYGSSAHDPSTFDEDTPRSGPATHSIERALLEAESLVRDFSEDNPAHAGDGAPLRQRARPPPHHRHQPEPVAPVLPVDLRLRPPAAVRRGGRRRPRPPPRHPGRLPGLYNVAGDGRLPWSEVAAICGTRLVPLSPYSPLKIHPLARLFDLPPELEDLLRYGRGVDTRRLAATGFDLPRHQRRGRAELHPRRPAAARPRARPPTSYTYEHDVEQFFRHSPSVTGARASAPSRLSYRVSHSARQLGLTHRPLLGGDGVAHVVLPHAVDLQEPLGDPLLADTELFDHPTAGRVPRDDRDLHPVQRNGIEGELQGHHDRFGREAPARPRPRRSSSR